jgi:hypothetical protein
MLKRTILGLAAVLLLAGCGVVSTRLGGQPTSVPTLISGSSAAQKPVGVQGAPLGSKQSGNLSVQVFSSPNPPIRGTNTFEALITDSRGQPITDATVSFDINMTNMNHGKNVVTAPALGEGRYRGNVSFMMPGPWRVIVGVARAGKTDTVQIDFTVNFR